MKILIGVSTAECASAFRGLLDLADDTTEVMAIAVVPGHSLLSAVFELPWRQKRHLEELRDLEKSHASELLASFKSEIERPGLQIETSVLVGDPAEELVKSAQRWHSDFIFVNRQEASAGGSWRLGHNASRVARYAKCSVLLLDPENPVPRTYLLATDGSPQAGKAGERLLQMPIADDPNLLICTVTTPFSPTFVRTGSLAPGAFNNIASAMAEQELAATQRILEASRRAFTDSPFRVRELARSGDTTEVLLRVIRENNVDLLALGAKGISESAEFLLGSVTLKLLEQVQCSILVAR